MDRKIIMTLLICLALIVPAFGAGVSVYGGTDANIASTGATANGVTVDNLNDNGFQATLTEGIRANVLIPAGVTGRAFARLHGSNVRDENVLENGQIYKLHAEFGGFGSNPAEVNVGAVKNLAAGVASASAKVIAESSVDNGFVNQVVYPGLKKNLLSGYAEISATTSNTGAGNAATGGPGTTYALANGYAQYRTSFTATDPSTNDKVAAGRAAGSVDLESSNLANGGSDSGTVKVRSESNADSSTSYARSKISSDLSSSRPGAAGTSFINAFVAHTDGTWAKAKDAATPASQSPWNVETSARGYIGGGADDNLIHLPIAYAQSSSKGDIAATNGYLDSQAWHDYAGPIFNKADNKAYVSTTVTRTTPRTTITGAETEIDFGAFNAISRETNVLNRYAQESANGINIESNAQLQSAGFTASNDKTLQLTAWRTGGSTPTHAKITDTVNLNLPLTGNTNDQSEIEQSAASLLAKAVSGSKTLIITSPSVNVEAYKTGITPIALASESNNPATATGTVTASTGSSSTFGITESPTNWRATVNVPANY